MFSPACFLKMDVPERTDVRLVGDYQPSGYSFEGFRKGVKPSELAQGARKISQN